MTSWEDAVIVLNGTRYYFHKRFSFLKNIQSWFICAVLVKTSRRQHDTKLLFNIIPRKKGSNQNCQGQKVTRTKILLQRCSDANWNDTFFPINVCQNNNGPHFMFELNIKYSTLQNIISNWKTTERHSFFLRNQRNGILHYFSLKIQWFKNFS